MATTKHSQPSTETTVMFVDDEPDLLELYELLYGSDYAVVTASGGEEAIEKFGEYIDFAFFDRRMPEMTGDELIRSLRDDGHRTPMGIISAVEPDPTIDAEYDAYLTKPVDESDVHNTVDEHTS